MVSFITALLVAIMKFNAPRVCFIIIQSVYSIKCSQARRNEITRTDHLDGTTSS